MMCHDMSQAGVLNTLITFGLIIWFTVFSLLVLNRLDKIIVLLSKK